MSNIIKVENVTFSYFDYPILKDISFEIREGDFVAITGANGTGKSTLLKLLLGELSPNSGTLSLFEQDIHYFKDFHKIGVVPQNGLYSKADFPATVREIVTLNLYSQIGMFRFPTKIHKKKVMDTLRLVGMDAYSKRMIGTLSGGQLQKVLLARVLVSDPKLMILDEPTNGVDAKSVVALYELLRELNEKKGLTIIMVTHDISGIRSYAKRMFCLEEGTVVELEHTQIDYELSHKHKHPNGGASCNC